MRPQVFITANEDTQAMIIYFAGFYTSGWGRRRDLIPKKFSTLESYWYLKTRRKRAGVVTVKEARCEEIQNFFLDSGAYTAHSKGITITLDEYIKYVHANKKYTTVYCVLDSIGNAKETWDAQKEMEKQGLNPLPVFHSAEDVKYLKRYVDNYEYVGIGGAAGSAKWSREYYFDRIRSVLLGPGGVPRIRIHGFGITEPQYMLMFPWYSVDSTSWVLQAAYGAIYVLLGKKWHVLPTSPRYSNANKPGAFHWNHISKEEKDVIRQKMVEYSRNTNNGKFTEKDLCNDGYARQSWNMHCFMDLVGRYEELKKLVLTAQEFFV